MSTCLACGGATDDRPGHGWRACVRCRSWVRASLPDPTDHHLAHEDEYFGEEERSAMTAERRLAQYVERFDRVVGLRGAAVLDVGAGTADLASPILASGATYTALESSATARAELRSRGHDVVAATSDLAPGRTFDAAILVEVIEHVLDPVAFMAGLAAVLAPGAGVYITTPNARSLNGRVHGGDWWAARLPTHVAIYSLDGLDRILRSAGMHRTHRHRRVGYGKGWVHQTAQSGLQALGLDGGLRVVARRNRGDAPAGRE